MWINITKKDIEDGNKAVESCPITLALCRVFGIKLSISRDYLRIQKKKSKHIRNKWVLLPLPEKVKAFILNYEANLEDKPFRFWLDEAFINTVKEYA